MRRVNFDLDALRTFVAGADLGSFSMAAERVGRSASAVSAQLKKLEEQAGTPLLQKSGRALVLTGAGETLLGYARRMLGMNDEALLALAGSALEGKVRLGLQEDFSAHLLPDVLGSFSRSHRGVQIEVTVGRNADLLDAMREGRLDLALAWNTGGPTPYMDILGSYPLRWIGPGDADMPGAGWPPAPDAPLPLVCIEAPCRLRSAATQALDAAGMPWRLVYSSPSLGGVWAAVAAGLGVAVRTGFGLPRKLVLLAPEQHALPALPQVELALHRSHQLMAPAVARLHGIIVEHIQRDSGAPRQL